MYEKKQILTSKILGRLRPLILNKRFWLVTSAFLKPLRTPPSLYLKKYENIIWKINLLNNLRQIKFIYLNIHTNVYNSIKNIDLKKIRFVFKIFEGLFYRLNIFENWYSLDSSGIVLSWPLTWRLWENRREIFDFHDVGSKWKRMFY